MKIYSSVVEPEHLLNCYFLRTDFACRTVYNTINHKQALMKHAKTNLRKTSRWEGCLCKSLVQIFKIHINSDLACRYLQS